MAPPIPPSPEADAAAVGAVPARPRRVAAAWVLDYLAFCVLWAAAARLPGIGPPPSGWLAMPVFLGLEWVLVRRGRTPGMAALALRRIPAGPGRFLWVADDDPARRENAVSVLAGLLFLAEGLHLWAAAVGNPAALPLPLRALGGAGPAAALLWGALWLGAGWGLLRLAPWAPTVAAALLLATLASLSLWPWAWGAWFTEALAARRAAVGGLLPEAHAAWLRAWFPVAAWLLCALGALAVAGNRRPFRRAPAGHV